VTVTNVDKDLDARTLTITAEFDAPLERVWELWADPRKLERWWGPPMAPSTFERHELEPGGTVTYFMTSPEGERYHGLWQVQDVEPTKLIVVEDTFADEAGNADPELPTSTMQVTFAERDGGGTTMSIVSTLASTEAMAQTLEMGMEEGIRSALGQTDALLAETA